jgi:hypothetical protein
VHSRAKSCADHAYTNRFCPLHKNCLFASDQK